MERKHKMISLPDKSFSNKTKTRKEVVENSEPLLISK
jgi:hypothetical protein